MARTYFFIHGLCWKPLLDLVIRLPQKAESADVVSTYCVWAAAADAEAKYPVLIHGRRSSGDSESVTQSPKRVTRAVTTSGA